MILETEAGIGLLSWPNSPGFSRLFVKLMLVTEVVPKQSFLARDVSRVESRYTIRMDRCPRPLMRQSMAAL